KPAIYPTMTNGEINIAIPGGEEVRLKIFSVAGELISEYNIAYSSAIDLKDLVNGWYLIRLENANFSEIFRVLKI
ncbi:MAG: T9SS type A sorting domain-containing protein, partial [Saprospiraceae bacterium]|nr:T9SS type A sorting domain-containing protein [Saprospiraceae bacterium]